MSYIPSNPNGQATSANSEPVVIASDQSAVPISGSVSVSNFPATQPISATALPLPSGASTSAAQTTANATLATIASNTANAGTPTVSGTVAVSNFPSSQAVTGTFWPATQPVSASSLPLPTGAATAANQSTMITTLSAIDAGIPTSLGQNTMANSMSVALASDQSALPVTGAFFQATQPVSAASLPLPTGAATAANQSTMISSLSTIATNTTGVATASAQTTGNSSLSTIATNTTALTDMYITGQSTQTATVNNILPATSGTAATDTIGYHSASVQVTSTGTGGTFIFEGSNDNVNFQAIPIYSQLILTGTPITAAITASASQLIYTFPLPMRYVRLRIATTITGGSIQAFTRLSQTSWTPAITQVAQATSGNLNVTVGSGTVTTVSTVTNDNAAMPSSITDVASAAITTTTTTATLSPTYGNAYQVNIPVTAVSGTTPTMDIEIQESRDGGTNWIPIYDFPRITATGSYNSPMLQSTGTKVRYVQTISGTTPSFTRAINRLQQSVSGASFSRQIIDRTISLTTLSSTTAALNAEQQTKNVMLTINIGAATTAPAVQIQASDDAGATWYLIGSPLTAIASSTVSTTVSNVTAQQFRAIVTTSGSAVTAGYTLVRSF